MITSDRMLRTRVLDAAAAIVAGGAPGGVGWDALARGSGVCEGELSAMWETPATVGREAVERVADDLDQLDDCPPSLRAARAHLAAQLLRVLAARAAEPGDRLLDLRDGESDEVSGFLAGGGAGTVLDAGPDNPAVVDGEPQLGPPVRALLDAARGQAARTRATQVAPVHVLLALVERSPREVAEVLSHLHVDPT